MNRIVLLIGLCLLLGVNACGLVTKPIAAYTVRDLTRVQEMAETYGPPEVAVCAAYLQEAIAGKQQLLDEDVDGLLSLAFKAYLLREGVAVAEQQFKDNCGPFAAGLMLEAAKATRGF